MPKVTEIIVRRTYRDQTWVEIVPIKLYPAWRNPDAEEVQKTAKGFEPTSTVNHREGIIRR